MGENTTIEHNGNLNRFETHVSGTLAGHADYLDHNEKRVFHHTEVAEEFRGEGIASELVSAALTATRDQGKLIVPVCPYIVRYVETHPEFNESLSPVTPQILAALNSTPKQ